jgi:hypothetical protein
MRGAAEIRLTRPPKSAATRRKESSPQAARLSKNGMDEIVCLIDSPWVSTTSWPVFAGCLRCCLGNPALDQAFTRLPKDFSGPRESRCRSPVGVGGARLLL